MKKTGILLLSVLASLSLVSCGGGTASANPGGNSVYNPPVSQEDNSKEKAIAYIKDNGTSQNGKYFLMATRTSTSGTYTYNHFAALFYGPSTDYFGVVAITDGSNSGSTTTVEWSLSSAFSWEGAENGAYIGQVLVGSYEVDFDLTVNSTTQAAIGNSVYSVTKNTLGLASSDIKNSVALCISLYNEAVAWANERLASVGVSLS